MMTINHNNKEQPLVSIITPCYNGEKFVHRFLDSVLNQTYINIELIFINDGSTDKTEEIVLSYKKKFISKGIKFKYIYQKNKGQAVALNQGLKIFTGDYITWPDSDDILHKDNIKTRVSFLEQNNKYNVVLCESKLVDENLNTTGILRRIPPKEKDNLFHDLIIEKNSYFAGGAYMIRTIAFLDANPNKHIYESRGGQNWQMLLPVLYKNKCGYLTEQLYYIFVRPNSHSRRDILLADKLKKCDTHEDILRNIIIEMNKEDKVYYLKLIKQKYARKRLTLASEYRDRKLMKEYYDIMKEEDYLRLNDHFIYLKGNSTIVFYSYKVFKLLLRILRKIRRGFA